MFRTGERRISNQASPEQMTVEIKDHNNIGKVPSEGVTKTRLPIKLSTNIILKTTQVIAFQTLRNVCDGSLSPNINHPLLHNRHKITTTETYGINIKLEYTNYQINTENL